MIGRSTEPTAETPRDLPPEWEPVDHLALVDDKDAHALWCALFDWPGDEITTESLGLKKWRIDLEQVMPRLVRYGLLREMRTLYGAHLGWHRTPKGKAWAIQTCFGAWTSGHVRTKDAPAWFLQWVVENEPGFAHDAERELARRTTKRVRR